MRAAFCLYGPNGLGGPATWVRRMLPRLADRGIDAVAVSYHTRAGECLVLDDLRRAGIPVQVIDADAVSPLEGVQRTLEVFAKLRPHVVVADHVVPAFVAGGWTRARGVATVMVLRGDDPWYWHLMDAFLAGGEAMRAAAVVAVSAELARAAREKAPPAVEVMRCASGTILPATTAEWSRSPFHATYVGRLDEGKRVSELVDVLIATSRSLPDFSASLLGDGPLRDAIEQTLRRETGHRVSYAGLIASADVFERLLSSQALILLSRSEGLSTAIQEAMACGLPVIARRTPSGTDGVLVHERTALLVENDDDVPAAVRRLMDAEGLWQRLSAGARAMAHETFDIDRAADRWAALLKRIAATTTWPPHLSPSVADGEGLYLAYLQDKRDLETYEATFFADHAEAVTPGLVRFLNDGGEDWDARRCALQSVAVRGLLDRADVASLSALLADEADARADRSDGVRYRTAALRQRAREFDRAEKLFSELADTTDDRDLRAGSLFHLAQIARDTHRSRLALDFARRCLSVEPEHRAARALHEALTSASDRSDPV